MVLLAAAPQTHSAERPFVIRVVDETTGRGIPLVELRTVNNVSWWTDSAGMVAFHEPGLMGHEVFFHIQSPGYEFPKDFFENRGVKLRARGGAQTEIKLKRTQIAERLYRSTGQGIYRDTLLAGRKPPLKQPVLSGQVMGQDTVVVTPYRGKLYWFWGDTDRPSYPLGNFGVSAATSELPGRGGLDPAVGIDFDYFTAPDGFSRPMCPDAQFGPGLKWIEGVMTIRENNREHLLARVAAGTGLQSTREWHLARFDDSAGAFESLAKWDIHETHDSSHAFHARVDGTNYIYLFPDFRVRARLESLRDLRNYEAFTCVAGDGKLRGADTGIDRDAAGRVRYGWKPAADRLRQGALRELIRAGKLKPGETGLAVHDLETGKEVEIGRGSVFWNDYRRRWVRIGSGAPGEIWFSEADTPTGPWLFARRIAEHGRYNFYNPTQHPFFDQDGGRTIFFEGTYTASFSGAPAKTPRYDYNQILYRLALDDERLRLPAPVYLRPGAKFSLRKDVEADRAWAEVRRAVFCAIPPTHSHRGLVPVWQTAEGLTATAPEPDAAPSFLVLPPDGPNTPGTEPLLDHAGKNIGRAWVYSLDFLPLDWKTQPGR